MDRLRQDLGHAARRLARDRSFTIVAIVTLSLGIGANTAIFSILKAVILQPLPYGDPAPLVMVWNTEAPEGSTTWLSLREVDGYRKDTSSYAQVSAYAESEANITGGQEPERIRVAAVTPELLSTTLRTLPVIGRVFGGSEGTPGGDNNVVVIGHSLWLRRYGGDPSALGRTLHLNGIVRTIVGVMPASFQLPTDYRAERPTEAWIPLVIDPANLGGWGDRGNLVVARLRDGATPANATSELRVVWQQWVRAGYVRDQGDSRFARSAVPLQEFIVGRVQTPMMILLGTVLLVLLIAIANVANLQLAKADIIGREIAVRAALGASRGRLARQMLVESVLLGAAGGAAGVALAWAGIRLVHVLNPSSVPRVASASLDPFVLASTAALSSIAGLMFGLVPALQFSKPNLTAVLHDGGRGGTVSRARLATRRALVIVQMALSVVLVLGAGLLTRSLIAINRVDLGFDPRNILTAQLALAPGDYPQGERVQAFYTQLLDRLEHVPGVARAGAIRILPLARTIGDWSITLEGRPYDPVANPNADFQYATGGYFPVMGIALLRGRFLTDADDEKAEMVAVVNDTLAMTYWPGEDAIGKRFHLGTASQPWLRIVGIVGQVHHNEIVEEPRGEMYLPYAQAASATGSPGSPPRAMTIAIKTRSNPLAMVSPLREVVRSMDPNLPLSQVKTMEQVTARILSDRRFTTLLLGFFAVLALTLAAIGVYGTVALIVSERTQEVGIRLALGAQRGSIMRMVLTQGMGMTAAGITIGLAAAAVLTRLLAALLYGVTALDAATFAAAPTVLGAVAAIACVLPARRAAAIDPAESLRR